MFVFKSSDEAEVKILLDGVLHFLPELALITTVKDGVYKRRLILVCRASGANDHASKDGARATTVGLGPCQR